MLSILRYALVATNGRRMSRLLSASLLLSRLLSTSRPLPQMSDTSSVSTIYDDSSDQIQYTGPWYPIQSNDPGIHDSALTGVNGRASFSFSFLGESLSLFSAHHVD